jgi:MYXO-CTERM domain-containing protein
VGGCTADCAGRECGDDGCGGQCLPGCGPNETCDSNGVCQCAPQCAGKECGVDGCGGQCAPGCGAGETCDANGICVSCTPACTNKECGPDGCGGQCAPGCQATETCNASWQCEPGTGQVSIQAISPDFGYTDVETPVSITGGGFKSGATVRLGGTDLSAVQILSASLISATVPSGMEPGTYMLIVLNSDGGTASLADAFEVRERACDTDCAGKECGDDGCGGQCPPGCGTGESCDASGQCVGACTPECTGKQCGPDGCDGVCGTCEFNETCNTDGQCIGTTGNDGGCGCGSSADGSLWVIALLLAGWLRRRSA